MVDGHEMVTVTVTVEDEVQPTPFHLALISAIARGTVAIAADMREMAEGRYTGRHSQAFLDGPSAEG